MKYFKVRIVVGTSDSTFDIYYDSVNSGTRALLYDTGLPAIGLTNEVLETGEGITVSVPDEASSIVLSSSPTAFCSDGTTNDSTFSIPLGCISYTVSSSAGVFNYYYTDCNCIPVSATLDATSGYTEQTFCALQDSVNSGLLTIVDNGICSNTYVITGILCGDWQSNTEPLSNDEFENIILGYVNFDSKLLSGETIDPSGSFVDIVSYSTIGSGTIFSVPSGDGTLQFYTSSSIGEFPTIIINQGGINEVVNTFTFSGYVLTDSARLLTLDNITSPYTSSQGIGGLTPQSNALSSECTPSPACNATSSIVLRYSTLSAQNACIAPNATPYFTFNGSNFATTELLYTNNNCTGVAPNGYYSNGTIARYWNGSNLDTPIGCT